MSEILDIFLSATFWAAAIRIATPLLLATLGELLCERAGVLNLGIEGIMVAGAMTGWYAVHQGLPLAGGVAVAAAVGMAFGLLHGIMTVPLALSQHVTGIGITMLATSLSAFSYRALFPNVTTPPSIEAMGPVAPDLVTALPFLGPALFSQTWLTWAAFAAVPLLGWLLFRTPLGLAIRASGENPAAVESQGLNVQALRILAVMLGSGLMAVGGAFLTLSAFNSFFIGMMNGRGWICIALVVFAAWHPGKALLGAMLFGIFDAFQLRLQQVVGGAVPYQIFLMLPYLLSIAALILMSRRSIAPQALMRPYLKGQR